MKTNGQIKPIEQGKTVLGSVKTEPKQSALKQIQSALTNISRGIYLF